MLTVTLSLRLLLKNATTEFRFAWIAAEFGLLVIEESYVGTMVMACADPARAKALQKTAELRASFMLSLLSGAELTKDPHHSRHGYGTEGAYMIRAGMQP
jgi:hypothetical protein